MYIYVCCIESRVPPSVETHDQEHHKFNQGAMLCCHGPLHLKFFCSSTCVLQHLGMVCLCLASTAWMRGEGGREREERVTWFWVPTGSILRWQSVIYLFAQQYGCILAEFALCGTLPSANCLVCLSTSAVCASRSSHGWTLTPCMWLWCTAKGAKVVRAVS